jgi:hypothetical protein
MPKRHCTLLAGYLLATENLVKNWGIAATSPVDNFQIQQY